MHAATHEPACSHSRPDTYTASTHSQRAPTPSLCLTPTCISCLPHTLQVLVRVLTGTERAHRQELLLKRRPQSPTFDAFSPVHPGATRLVSETEIDVEGGGGRGGGFVKGEKGQVLFASLLDAIRTLDCKRRLAASCGPLLQDSPGILPVS